MKALVLDSEAFSVLARHRIGPEFARVQRALQGALEAGSAVVVPAAVLAEQYRGGGHDQAVDACLGRHTGIGVADTTRDLARTIGRILARAGRGSEDHVDASAVAAAASYGGGVVLTADTDDLDVLAAGVRGVRVEPL